MNYKGIKDKIHKCKNCGSDINFKAYSGNYHKFCNSKCNGEYKSKQTYLKFKEGKVRNRRIIHRILSKDCNKCNVCGIDSWNDNPIRLWVDHIDGNASNNMPYNFRLICPNCESQSSTFSNRNKGKGRKSRGMEPFG